MQQLGAIEHVAAGLALLIDQYKDKPRIAAWISSSLRRCNDIETSFQQILTKRDLDTAVAAQLDVLGKIVGQVRVGATDEIYRLFILVRILVNRSLGHGDDIEAVVQAAINSTNFALYEFFPASIVVDVVDPIPANASLIADFIHDARSIGVGSSLQWVSSSMSIFQFASGDTEEFVPTTGWGDTGETVGGHMMGVI